MSSDNRKQGFPTGANGNGHSPLFLGHLRVHQQSRHANHGGHRSADFVSSEPELDLNTSPSSSF